jgi:hypothetical protein
MMKPDQFTDPYRTSISRQEVVSLLRKIEHHRYELTRAAMIFDNWLDHSEELYDVWREFQQAGGITSSELERHLDGRIFRHRPVRARGHLRLIVSNKRRAHRLTRMRDDDDAA